MYLYENFLFAVCRGQGFYRFFNFFPLRILFVWAEGEKLCVLKKFVD